MFRKTNNNLSAQSLAVEQFAIHLPLVELLDDGCTLVSVVEKEMYLVQVLRLHGRDMALSASVEAAGYHQQIKMVCHAMEPTVTFSFFTDRILHHDAGNEVALEYGNAHANRVAAEYKQHCRQFNSTQTHLVMVLKVGRFGKQMLQMVSADFQREHAALTHHVNQLNHVRQDVVEALQVFRPQLLSQADVLSFWARQINGGQEVPVPKKAKYVDQLLAISEVEFQPLSKHMVFHLDGRCVYAAYLSINIYPDKTHAHLLDHLLSIAVPMSLVQHVLPINQEKTKAKIDRLIANLNAIPSLFNHERINDLIEAGNMAEAGSIQFVWHMFSLCVYGESEEQLSKHLALVQSALRSQGVMLIRERFHLAACYWSRFPGLVSRLQSRQRMITTDNLADFNMVYGQSVGYTHCAFGPHPVSRFLTDNGGVYDFIFQRDDKMSSPGHALIIGHTGGGKTVLANWLLMQCLKFRGHQGDTPMRMLVFDAKKGCMIPIQAFGGVYRHGCAHSLTLNPLQLPDTKANRHFLERFIAMLAGGVDIQEERIITRAVAENYTYPHEFRSLHHLREMFGTKGARTEGGRKLMDRLEKWLPNQDDPSTSPFIHGMVFNGQSDCLHFDKPLLGFDMGDLLHDKDGNAALLGPLTAYIFHAFHHLMADKPVPHLAFFDEMWRYIKDPFFAHIIEEAYKEWRKLGGVVMGAVQNVSSLLDQTVGQEIINNTATFLLFPDRQAKAEHYQEVLGLNDREFHWIKHSLSNKRQVMVKRNGGESIILNIDLSCLGDDLSLFSSEKHHIYLAEQSKRQQGTEDEWVSRYLDLVKQGVPS